MQAPLRYCAVPGCREKVTHGRCSLHHYHKRAHETRYQHGQTGYGRKWRKARTAFITRPENVLCVQCKAQGHIRRADEVDHIIPHKGDQAIFWNEANWQPLCRMHHSIKTANEMHSSRFDER